MIPNHLYLCSFPTGSNYICNPPVTDTDIDEMFYVYSLEETKEILLNEGWKEGGIGEYAIGDWAAFRKDKNNALITDNKHHYDKFEAATELAKKRNLLNKEDRVKLFHTIVGKQHAKTTEF